MNEQLTAENTNINDLAPSLQNLVSIMGLDNTLNLINHLGGTRVFVPKNYRPASRLARYLDDDGFRKLIEAFKGEPLTIATGFSTRIKIRNRKIISDFDRHMSVKDIARREHLTERQIYSIINRVI